jgi:hypothetical protein
VHRGLPCRVAASDDEHFFVLAKCRLTGTSTVVDTRSVEPIFSLEPQASIVDTRRADGGASRDAGAVRQNADTMGIGKLSACAFSGHQYLCAELASLLPSSFSQVGTANTFWKSKIIFDSRAGASLTTYGVAFDKNSLQAFGSTIALQKSPASSPASVMTHTAELPKWIDSWL